MLRPDIQSEIQEDFFRLPEALALHSKVLFDFHGVLAFCPESINSVAEFSKRLRNKGSGVVLY